MKTFWITWVLSIFSQKSITLIIFEKNELLVTFRIFFVKLAIFVKKLSLVINVILLSFLFDRNNKYYDSSILNV